jgi:hypothetical protein
MRSDLTRTLALAAAVALAGCVAVDPQDAVRRAAAGTVLGATLGAGAGAAFAINPVIGASFGAAGGAAVGAVAGVITAQPAVEYGPVPPHDTAVAPGFYDTWPPGYTAPPIGVGTPPPPARSG